MNSKDIELLMQAVAPVIRDFVTDAIKPLTGRLDELEKVRDAEPKALAEFRREIESVPDRIKTAVDTAIAALPAPKDGESVTPEDVEPMLGQMVADAVKALPAPEAGRDADPAEVARLVDEAVARAVEKLPKPENGKSLTAEDLRPLVAEVVSEAVKALPPPKDGQDAPTAKDLEPMIADQVAIYLEFHPPAAGKDVDPLALKAAVSEAIAALPAPKDGKSVTPEDLQPVVDKAVAAAVEALPAPVDGTSVTIEDVRPLIEQAVSDQVKAMPTPKDGRDAPAAEDLQPVIVTEVEAYLKANPPAPGRDADPELVATTVREAVAARPMPTVEDVRPMLDELVAAAVKNIPTPADGVGLAGAVIDRGGELVVTLTNGKAVSLGKVVGQDGEPGVGFDDLSVEHDGGRTFTLRFMRGEQAKEFKFALPVVLDRGVFKDGTDYVAGDGVTAGGSFWIAQKETAERPGTSDAWRLSVKKGRDGKDGQAPPAPVPVKLR